MTKWSGSPKNSPSGRARVVDPQAIIDEINEAGRELYGPSLSGRDYHPLVELGIAAMDPKLPASQKIAANSKLAEFLFAKKKAVEVEGDGAGGAPQLQVVVLGNHGEVQEAPPAIQQRVLGRAAQIAVMDEDDDDEQEDQDDR